MVDLIGRIFRSAGGKTTTHGLELIRLLGPMPGAWQPPNTQHRSRQDTGSKTDIGLKGLCYTVTCYVDICYVQCARGLADAKQPETHGHAHRHQGKREACAVRLPRIRGVHLCAVPVRVQTRFTFCGFFPTEVSGFQTFLRNFFLEIFVETRKFKNVL